MSDTAAIARRLTSIEARIEPADCALAEAVIELIAVMRVLNARPPSPSPSEDV